MHKFCFIIELLIYTAEIPTLLNYQLGLSSMKISGDITIVIPEKSNAGI